MPVVLRSATARHVLHGPKSRLGRSPACELSIPGGADSVVSWEHAWVEVVGGRVLVCDLGSTNGTFLNGVKLEAKRTLGLAVGDRIRFGATGPEFVVEAIDLTPPPVTLLPPPPPPPAPIPEPQAAGTPRVPPTVSARRAAPTNTQLHRAVEHLHSQGRTVMVLAAVGVGVCLLAVGLIAAVNLLSKRPVAAASTEPEPKAEPKPLTGSEIDARLKKSVVWILCGRKGGLSQGTGVLVDGPNKLVLTADHVVRGAKEVKVAFPRKRSAGPDFVTDREEYMRNDWFVPAAVVRNAPAADLALLKITGPLPDGAEPIALSSSDPAKGDACHTVGNQGNSGLWVYNRGLINQIEFREAPLKVGDEVVDVATWVYQSTCAVNPGDSGGPLVNDRGELIGVNSSVQVVLNTANRHVARNVVEAFVAGRPLPGPRP